MVIVCMIVILGIICAHHFQKPLSTIFKEEDLQGQFVSNERKGIVGEEEIIDFLHTLPGKYVLFQNIYLPLQNSEHYTEIDLTVVHEKGIFVIESKNYQGAIHGEATERNWRKSVSSTYEQNFYNPIYQNDTHIKALQRALPNLQEENFYSLVVFGKGAELYVDQLPAKNVFVMKTTQLSALYDIIYASKERLPFLEIAEELTTFTADDWATKTAHIARLKQKYSKKVS